MLRDRVESSKILRAEGLELMGALGLCLAWVEGCRLLGLGACKVSGKSGCVSTLIIISRVRGAHEAVAETGIRFVHCAPKRVLAEVAGYRLSDSCLRVPPQQHQRCYC